MKKLLAIDLDDTLLNNKKRIGNETINALKKVKALGYEIVPVTGRAYICLPYELTKENIFRYVVVSNGARIIDTLENKIIYKALVKIDDALKIIEKCDEKKLGITAHIGNDHIVQGRPLYLMGRLIFKKDAKRSKIVKSLKEYAKDRNESLGELQFFFFNEKKKQAMIEITHSISNYDYSYSKFYCEVYSKDATKGKSLTKLENLLGYQKEDIICIGDSENDISMFNASGYKFAMGNAIDELKKLADEVLPSNKDKGVLTALNKLINK